MTHQIWISGKAIRPLFAEPVTFVIIHEKYCHDQRVKLKQAWQEAENW